MRPIAPTIARLPVVRIVRFAIGFVLVAFVVILPHVLSVDRSLKASALLIYATLGLSLVVLTGWAGQISLGQFAFVGVGAAVAGGLVANHGTDFITALLVAGLVGAAFSVLIGLPAVRLPGLFLAVTTLAFSVATATWFLSLDWIPNQIDRPEFLWFDSKTDERTF